MRGSHLDNLSSPQPTGSTYDHQKSSDVSMSRMKATDVSTEPSDEINFPNQSSSLCFNCDFCREKMKIKSKSKLMKINHPFTQQQNAKLVFLLTFTKEFLQMSGKIQKLRSKHPSCGVYKCPINPREILLSVTKEITSAKLGQRLKNGKKTIDEEDDIFEAQIAANNPVSFQLRK